MGAFSVPLGYQKNQKLVDDKLAMVQGKINDLTQKVSCVWHDSFTCVTWLKRFLVCDMSHSRVWHDSQGFMCVTWLIHVCGMTQKVSSLRVTWRTYTCDMTHSCVWHVSFTCVAWHSRFQLYVCMWVCCISHGVSLSGTCSCAALCSSVPRNAAHEQVPVSVVGAAHEQVPLSVVGAASEILKYYFT